MVDGAQTKAGWHYKHRCEIDGCCETFFLRGRHHCRQCGSSICSAHFHRPKCVRCSPLRPVLKEILTTETDYVRDLRSLVAAREALTADGLLSRQQAVQIFGNVEVLARLHCEFLTRLDQTAEELPPVEAVADALTALAPYFRPIYAEYCSSYASALRSLAVLQTRLAVSRGSVSDGLDSLLIKPVQRLTKYPLLLKELLGRMAARHPQRAALEVAERVVGEASREVNRRVKRAEASERLMRANDELRLSPATMLGAIVPGGVLAPSRSLRLVADVRHRGKAHRLYVFSDTALLARKLSAAAASAAAATVASRLLVTAPRPRACFAAKQWLPLENLAVAHADGPTLTLSLDLVSSTSSRADRGGGDVGGCDGPGGGGCGAGCAARGAEGRDTRRLVLVCESDERAAQVIDAIGEAQVALSVPKAHSLRAEAGRGSMATAGVDDDSSGRARAVLGEDDGETPREVMCFFRTHLVRR